MNDTEPLHHHPLTYFVNAEAQRTERTELKVKEIIEVAGFTPFSDYRLTRDEGHQAYDDYDYEVRLHEGECFTATFIGITPTS